MSVRVRTNGDDFASLECGAALIELTKDGDSPACPDSWTWYLWYDGQLIDSDILETSIDDSVRTATMGIANVIGELEEVRDYLIACGAFGKGPEEA